METYQEAPQVVLGVARDDRPPDPCEHTLPWLPGLREARDRALGQVASADTLHRPGQPRTGIGELAAVARHQHRAHLGHGPWLPQGLGPLAPQVVVVWGLLLLWLLVVVGGGAVGVVVFSRCGMWSHVLLQMCVWNVPHGPWSQDTRNKEAQAC